MKSIFTYTISYLLGAFGAQYFLTGSFYMDDMLKVIHVVFFCLTLIVVRLLDNEENW